MNKYELSASLICCDPLNLERDLKEIEKAKFGSIHFDVMDGVFVPRYGLYPEILSSLRKKYSIPVSVHLMVSNPDSYIDLFKKSGADVIYVHAEENSNLRGTVQLIKKLGMKAGVAIKIGTPVDVLDDFLSEIDYILLMAIQPGVLGQELMPQIYETVSKLKTKIIDYPIKISIDGGVNAENAAKLIRHGADILVCGTSSIFKLSEGTITENVARFKNIIKLENTE